MRKLILLLSFFFSSFCFSQTKGSDCEKFTSQGIEAFKKKQYTSAVGSLEKALRICGRDTAMADYDYYLILMLTSISYYEIGRHDSAIITGEGAMRFFQKVPNLNEPLYFSMLGRMGFSYMNYSEFYNAAHVLEIASSYFQKKNGDADDFYLDYSSELANAYSALGFYDKSMQLNRKLKSIISNTKGKETAIYITVITNMGNDFANLGFYDSSRAHHQESLELRAKVLGKTHTEYAKGLGNLGGVYAGQRRYADAIFLYEEAKNIYEKSSANRSLEYAALLTNMGECYCSLDQYYRGTELMVQGLGITETNLGRYNTSYALGVQKIAAAYVNAGGEQNTKDAIGFYKIALGIMNKIWADSTLQYASLLSGIGNAYINANNQDSALYFLKHSESLLKALNLENSENYVVLLGRIASVYQDKKNYNASINAYLQALTIIKNIYGENYPSLSTVLNNLSLVYYEKGDHLKADSLFRQTFLLNRSYILQNTEGLSEEEKETFAFVLKANATLAVGLRLEKGLKLENEWLTNSSLFYKGLLLEGARGMTKAFSSFTDSALKRKVDEYLYLKAYLGNQQLKPKNMRDSTLRDVQNRVTDLERSLLKGSTAYRKWKEQFETSVIDIQDKLATDDLAIEFLTYYTIKDGQADKENGKYAALLIRKNKAPEIVQLFSDQQLGKLFSKTNAEATVKKLYRSTVKSTSSQPSASDSLYHLIWKPLLPYLDNVKRVFFSADGVINNLSLAAIITPEGKRLIEDFEFIQLSSTRNLVNAAGIPSFKEVQLWGGVNYEDAQRKSTSANFAYLPGTLTEVNEIVSSTKSGRKVSAITGTAATEGYFKQLNGRSPEVLHIATHGFFFPDPKAGVTGDNKFALATNPLLRSGLALAGANSGWNADYMSSDKEDGILTAYEIADMDLSNTKLVVLSACETGLGDIKSGEGVYGLQRAFKLAGVDYLIMSLWQVPDIETKEFMTTFYTKCFSGVPVRKAFRETQLEMNKKYQPYQWAAFVLVE
jgi:CHAT domain-containing protein